MTADEVKRFNEKYRRTQVDSYHTKKCGVVKYRKKTKKKR